MRVTRLRATPRGGDPALWAVVAEGFLSRLSFGLVSFVLPLYACHLGPQLTEIAKVIPRARP